MQTHWTNTEQLKRNIAKIYTLATHWHILSCKSCCEVNKEKQGHDHINTREEESVHEGWPSSRYRKRAVTCPHSWNIFRKDWSTAAVCYILHEHRDAKNKKTIPETYREFSRYCPPVFTLPDASHSWWNYFYNFYFYIFWRKAQYGQDEFHTEVLYLGLAKFQFLTTGTSSRIIVLIVTNTSNESII